MCAEVSMASDAIKDSRIKIIPSPIRFSIPGTYGDMKGRSKQRYSGIHIAISRGDSRLLLSRICSANVPSMKWWYGVVWRAYSGKTELAAKSKKKY